MTLLEGLLIIPIEKLEFDLQGKRYEFRTFDWLEDHSRKKKALV